AYPHDLYAWGNMGIVLCKLGRYSEALEALDQTLKLDPTAQKNFSLHRCEAILGTKQYELAVQTVGPDDLSHNIFHLFLVIMNTHPKQGKLRQELLQLKNPHQSKVWQDAFLGGLTELANLARDFGEREEL